MIVVRTFMYTFLYPYRLCTAEMLSEADMNDHIEQHMRDLGRIEEKTIRRILVKDASLSPVIIR